MKHEYETMKHLWDQFYYKERQMTIPKPIDYWEDEDTLSVERIKGSRLSAILGYEGLPLLRWFYYTNLRERMNRAANWLAHFHSLTRKTQRISFNEALQEDLKNVILQWPPTLSQMQIEKCATKLRDLALSLDTTPHIITGRHGDFDPDNIIMSADQTCVIDFAYFSCGTPLLDVTNFMVTLELHSTPFHTMSFRNLRFYRKLANDFLVTYNSTADLPFSKDEVNLYRVLKFIRALGYAKKALGTDQGKSLQTSPRVLLLRLQSMYATEQIESFLENNDSRKKPFDK
jgi:aminoglycoside phosphotransferase (APT) family kinase protein